MTRAGSKSVFRHRTEPPGCQGRAILLAALGGGLCLHAADQPQTPAQTQASFQLSDPALLIECAAAEPDVLSPVDVAWDARGRLFVAEMIDYPAGPTAGQVRLLEDRDHDGRYESSLVFADALSFPNSLLPWNDGLLVTAAPHLWFLADTNQDGRADVRQILLTGFGEGNQQLRANGLFWGLDNWIYGANGRSDGAIRWADDPPEKILSLRGFDFRFRPHTRELEPTVGRSQFGHDQDDWGRRFLSWNTLPARQEVIPHYYLSRQPSLSPQEALHNLLPRADEGRVYPRSPPPLTFNRESVTHFNALAGLALYRGDLLGPDYEGNLFVGESLLSLVHRRRLLPHGPTFTAERTEPSSEFLTSTDPWFHPVNFATGPDGALYVVDFYRRFVEHPGFVPGDRRPSVDWRQGWNQGRIWRIRPRHSPAPAPFPRLDTSAVHPLVAHLNHPNAWWRDTAQRLLVERQDPAAAAPLRQLARSSSRPKARVHALYTLQGLALLETNDVLVALADPHPQVRATALRLAERTPALLAEVPSALAAWVNTPDPSLRLQLALSLGAWSNATATALLAQLARTGDNDPWITFAVRCSAIHDPASLFLQLAQVQPSATLTNELPLPLLRQLAELAGAHPRAQQADRILAWLRPPAGSTPAVGPSPYLQAITLLGLKTGHQRQSPPEPWTVDPATFSTSHRWALATVTNNQAATPERIDAVHLLGMHPPSPTWALLQPLLQPGPPPALQAAVLETILAYQDPPLALDLFRGWNHYARATRLALLRIGSGSSHAASAFLDALEQGWIQPREVDPGLHRPWLAVTPEALRPRLQAQLQPVTETNRQAAVTRFAPSLRLAGDGPRGARLFGETCLPCHTLAGRGATIGPDLSAIASRPAETLLIDILDPNRQVAPDYLAYTAQTTDQETLTGLIVAESSTHLTLRRANMPDTTLARTRLIELRAEQRSLMPEGFEQGWSTQDVADLLQFLRQPNPAWLPQ